jgi:hypothetical protein
MTTRTAYTDDEWFLLQRTPYEAGEAMMGVSKHKNRREHKAMMRSLHRAAEEFSSSELVGDLLRMTDDDERRIHEHLDQHKPAEWRDPMLDDLEAVAELLEKKGDTDEHDEYRRFVMYVSEAVARRTKGDGFLGLFGKRVTPHEQQLLDDIADKLDITEDYAGDTEGTTGEAAG